jgi:GAF domain-containing protein
LDTLFDEITDAGVDIMRADAGTVQLLDAGDSKLHLLASRGFPEALTRHFAVVDASSNTPCGAALANGKRVIMDFDEPDAPDPDGSIRLHREAGLSSAQSTPIVNRAGETIGMFSTYWKAHHRPSERDFRFLDLLGRHAADAIDRKMSDEAMHEQLEELTRFNAVAVGRETRMIELKKEVNELRTRAGEPARYDLEFEARNAPQNDE